MTLRRKVISLQRAGAGRVNRTPDIHVTRVALCRLSYASQIDKRTGAAARTRMRWQCSAAGGAIVLSGRSRCQTARAAKPVRRRSCVSHRAQHAAHVAWRARQAARARLRARTQRASREQKSVRMFSQVAWAISPSRLLAEGFLALPPVSPVGTPVGVRVCMGDLASRRRMNAIPAVDRTTARRLSA